MDRPAVPRRRKLAGGRRAATRLPRGRPHRVRGATHPRHRTRRPAVWVRASSPRAATGKGDPIRLRLAGGMGICTAMTDVAADSAALGRQLEALSRVSRAVAAGEGLQPVLDEIIEAARRLSDGE